MTLSNSILFNSNVFPSPESRIHILSCPVAAEKTEFFTVKLEHFTPPPISTPILQPSIIQSSRSTFSMLKQYPSGEIFVIAALPHFPLTFLIVKFFTFDSILQKTSSVDPLTPLMTIFFCSSQDGKTSSTSRPPCLAPHLSQPILMTWLEPVITTCEMKTPSRLFPFEARVLTTAPERRFFTDTLLTTIFSRNPPDPRAHPR